MKKYIMPTIKVATIKNSLILAGSGDANPTADPNATPVNTMESKSIFDYSE